MITQQNKSQLSLKAFAKINLFLEILGKRDDGYHEIVTVMQEIDLADEITIKDAKSGISLSCSDMDIPADSGNLIWKAADLIKRKFKIDKGVSIDLRKNIPVGAGLGGGSSDAAITLKGLNTFWQIGCDDDELMKLAAEIGSDVPFFIKGKTSLCTGRGEIVSPVLVDNEYIYVLVYPNLKIDTKSVYENLRLDLTKDRKDVNFFLNKLQTEANINFKDFLFNGLSETIYRLYPALLETKSLLEKFDFCGMQISGSGSSMFGLCERRCDAEKIKAEIEKYCMAKVFVVTNCLE